MMKVEFDFGEFIFYDKFVFEEIKEEMTLDSYHYELVAEQCRFFYKEASFGYISNRVNSFSINPMIYRQIFSKMENLKCIAVVQPKESMGNFTFPIEQFFYEGKMENFEKVVIARDWVLDQLDGQKTKVVANLQ